MQAIPIEREREIPVRFCDFSHKPMMLNKL